MDNTLQTKHKYNIKSLPNIESYFAGVFYCGAPGLTGELRRLAQDFSRKTSTKFDFHKENF